MGIPTPHAPSGGPGVCVCVHIPPVAGKGVCVCVRVSTCPQWRVRRVCVCVCVCEIVQLDRALQPGPVMLYINDIY